MKKIERTKSGVEYVFYGPNATLVSWMEDSALARQVMDDSGLDIETLFRSFSKNNPEEQRIAGKQAIGQLWHAYPEFGPYPFLETLSDFEFARTFYPDYREHVNHQLQVFWLGLYLFDSCELVRDLLKREAGSTDEFLRAWHACAIYHDIGYVLENEGANEPSGEGWDRVRNDMNSALKRPLSMIPKFGDRLTKDVERRIINEKRIFRPEILAVRDIDFTEKEDLLDRIAPFGLNAGLSSTNKKGQSPFRVYYDYAFKHAPGDRPRFRDHGIASALLLLRSWSDYREYVNELSKYTDDPLLKIVSKEIRKLVIDLKTCEDAVVRAAGAIALHNITPSLWEPADSLAHGLTLHAFQIRMLEDDPPPFPMAFLLGLADTLQAWDRPRFRALRKHDTPGLSDQGMQLEVEKGKIFLSFKEDEEFKNPESSEKSRFFKTCENLKQYLDNQAIDNLLQCGECVLPDEKGDREQTGPLRPAQLKVALAKLPVTGEDLFGREDEMRILDEAWENPETAVLTLVAFGGVGKTSLVNHWLNRMGRDGFRKASQVFGWSFYSQGAREGTQASADGFFAHALKWFGDPDPVKGSPWDRGIRLAELIRNQRTLLVLDGLEPFQYPPGPMLGRIKDQGLQALMRELRQYNRGLLVITTRAPVEDIADARGSTVKQIDLENLSEPACFQLLKKLGVNGKKDELEQAAREFGGHALALNLLGRFLSVVHDGDVRKRDLIADLTEEDKHGGHARRVMASYDNWLRCSPEGDILHLMGLFDRPASDGAIRSLRKPPAIPGLTDKLENLTDVQWRFALQHLRELRLLAKKDERRPDWLDCHPLVREHFGKKLKHDNPDAWKKAHSRLYEYFKDLPKKMMPDTLEEMEPLFTAAAHGCMAGRHQEAWDEVYTKRIIRGSDYYIIRQLGASGAWISVLSGFFDDPWHSPASTLKNSDAGILLTNAGAALHSLGRLREAIQPMQAGLDIMIKQKAWENAADAASNLSQLMLALGNVAGALEYGRQGVDFTDRSGDEFQKFALRTDCADALHQQGDLSKAEKLFIEAETMQKESQPQYPYLYSVQGYRYCDLLLSKGRYAEVRERAAKTLQWTKQASILLTTALDYLSIGRSFLLQLAKNNTDANATNTAERYLSRAVDGLRAAGQQDDLPRGLLARAHIQRLKQDFSNAEADLKEVRELAERSEMKLFLTDYHLESARLIRDRLTTEDDPAMQTKFKAHVQKAGKLIEETGYGRRKAEIEELEADAAQYSE